MRAWNKSLSTMDRNKRLNFGNALDEEVAGFEHGSAHLGHKSNGYPITSQLRDEKSPSDD